jgi:hypothetical protein
VRDIDGDPATGEVGAVVQSDDYMDTLQLRGIPISGQVLVEWPNGGRPVQRWVQVSRLERVVEKPKEAPQP